MRIKEKFSWIRIIIFENPKFLAPVNGLKKTEDSILDFSVCPKIKLNLKSVGVTLK